MCANKGKTENLADNDANHLKNKKKTDNLSYRVRNFGKIEKFVQIIYLK